MRKFLLASVIVFLTNICFAQITMDSVKVYPDSSGIIDSIYVKYTSQNQKIINFTYITFNDGCGTSPCQLVFKGCSTVTSVQKDTILTFGFWGLNSRFLMLYTVWDTSSTCTIPSAPLATDTFYYNVCYPTSLSETEELENNLKVYPNPAQNYFSLKLPEGAGIKQVKLLDLEGKLVRSYVNKNSIFELNSIANGIYYVKILTSKGLAVKKIVVRK